MKVVPALFLLVLLAAPPAAPAQSSAEGVAALRSSALAGSAEAAFELYEAYRHGRNVIRDQREAARWLQVAARAGLEAAQLELAQVLRDGALGLLRDPRQAYFWVAVLVQRRHADAVAQQDAYEQGLTANEVAEAREQAGRWQPAALRVRAGRVPLKDLEVPVRFASEEVTRENFAEVVRACIPDYSDAAVEQALRNWRFPVRNATTAIGTVRHAGALVVAESTAVCVRESEAGFPIWAAEALWGTIHPQGVPDAVRDDWYGAIARLIATKGFAEVLFRFPGQHATVAVFRPVRGPGMRVEYRASTRRAGEYDPSRYDAVFSHPQLRGVASVSYNGQQEKSILAHRFLKGTGGQPQPAPGTLPQGRST
ncbi:MAG TPA: tetratricopeptide repeat protein [Ramlibacter sp.]|nr:tetratricopeptide repeat protein [Ramlibacter sp.]